MTRYRKSTPRPAAAALWLVLAAACSLPDAFGPIEYDYQTILPAAYTRQPDARWPMILFLHGADGLEPKNRIFEDMARQIPDFPFVVIMPRTGTGWEPVSLNLMLEEVVDRYRVDHDRLYITGLSMGAYGSWTLAAYRPDRFAAMVLIAGGGDVRYACTLAHVPVWIVHNRDDPVVPAQESIYLAETLGACGGDVDLTINETVPPDLHPHDAWTPVYRSTAFYEWLLDHRKE